MDVSVGAVGAAAITAVVSLLSLIISKEAKTSEFRQQWIDALRSDIAEAISAVSLLLLLLNEREEEGDATLLHQPFTRTTAALARIELRLNLLEDDHVALQALVRETESKIRAAENGEYDRDATEDLSDRVVAQAQVILKREWDRVRTGEVTFQLTKALAALLLVGSGLYAAVVLGR